MLQAMSNSWGPHLKFEGDFLESFGRGNGIKTQFIPDGRLGVYQQVLHAHSSEPDLLEIDIVWPAILAADLVDIRPYLQDEQEFDHGLLDNYVVNGRLVALPVFIDLGVLYYRPELLEKYGFPNPPATWEDLERMARRIQNGERAAGNRDFWGYVWQGSVSEGGTCNALEWQASAGAGNFIEPGGRVHVRSKLFALALQRAADWIGTISPPAEYAYHEDDAKNLWDAGQAAFMRNWASGYGFLTKRPGKDHQHFSVAPLPAGPGGHKGTLGGAGMAVSKYAANRELAIKALLELTGPSNDIQRLLVAGGIPIHTALLERPELKSKSALLAISTELMNSTVARPSLILGDKYQAASLAYAKAVNSVLRRHDTPDAAMEKLEKTLMKITGFPAQPN
jgi:trehalose/maltose transport system substrate-binding protein